MSSATNVSSVVTSRYAKAVLDLAAEKKKVEQVEADMKDLSAMLEASDELRAMVHDPRISKPRITLRCMFIDTASNRSRLSCKVDLASLHSACALMASMCWSSAHQTSNASSRASFVDPRS